MMHGPVVVQYQIQCGPKRSTFQKLDKMKPGCRNSSTEYKFLFDIECVSRRHTVTWRKGCFSTVFARMQHIEDCFPKKRAEFHTRSQSLKLLRDASAPEQSGRVQCLVLKLGVANICVDVPVILLGLVQSQQQCCAVTQKEGDCLNLVLFTGAARLCLKGLS